MRRLRSMLTRACLAIPMTGAAYADTAAAPAPFRALIEEYELPLELLEDHLKRLSARKADPKGFRASGFLTSYRIAVDTYQRRQRWITEYMECSGDMAPKTQLDEMGIIEKPEVFLDIPEDLRTLSGNSFLDLHRKLDTRFKSYEHLASRCRRIKREKAQLNELAAAIALELLDATGEDWDQLRALADELARERSAQ